jgi:hypothetical protein
MVRAACLFCTLSVFAGCGPAGSDIQTYNLGDRVQAGPLAYAAYDTHWYLSLGQPPAPRVPVNRFLVVRMNITNDGAVDSHVPTLMVIDDSGQTYNELTDGTTVPDWMGIVRKVKPLEAEKGTVAFDVAPKHYKLRVADETDQIVSYIDLPLNLVPDEKGP